MLKLRINPIVAKELKNIRDYIAEDNEEYVAKTIKEYMVNLKIFRYFPELVQSFQNESVFGQTINMQYGKIM